VIDSATGDIARTTSGWIEDEKYGLTLAKTAGSASAEFDSAVTRTGRLTAKLSTTDTSGTGYLYNGLGIGGTATLPNLLKYGIPIKASTAYKLTCHVKTDNVAASGAYIQFTSYDSAGTRKDNTASSKLSGTNDWTKIELSITSNATAAFMTFGLFNSVAGNISDAWFDVNSMSLSEVLTINNPSATPAYLYPKAIADSSEDNIDQSYGTRDNSNAFGDGAGGHQKSAKGITPTKKEFTGVVVQRVNGSGTYVGDVTISLQKDSGTSRPSNTPIASLMIPNATWMGLTAGADYAVMFDYIVTPGTKYYIVFDSSTQDAANFTAYGAIAATGERYSYNGTSWGAVSGTNGGSIKTLYSKNTTNLTVSTATQSLSVTSPTTDGWADGTVIDTADGSYGVTPLTLAPGDNTVYIASNGPATADGEVDPSLQMTFSGTFWT
jgi:hypothetical protein